MYTVAHAASGGTAVVMAATPPVTPPVDWTGPVCWHVREGCERVFNVEGVDRTATVGDFVDAIARPPAGAAEDAFILVFMAVILLGGARKKFGGSRK